LIKKFFNTVNTRSFVNEQQRQVTNELDKLQLQRKDTSLHERSAKGVPSGKNW